MRFPVTEILQVLIGLCVVLAAVVLLRDIRSIWRKRRNQSPMRMREAPVAAPALPGLESELE